MEVQGFEQLEDAAKAVKLGSRRQSVTALARVIEESRLQAKKVFESFTDSQKMMLDKTWTLAYRKNTKGFIKSFVDGAHNDQDISESYRDYIVAAFERASPDLVIQTYDAVIRHLINDEFDKIFKLLSRVGNVHVDNDVGMKELTFIRKHILRVVKKTLGRGFSNDTKHTYVLLAGMVQVSICSAFRIKAVRDMIVPSVDEFAICREDFDNLYVMLDDTVSALLLLLHSASSSMKNFFPRRENLVGLLHGLNRLFLLTHDIDMLTQYVTSLGKYHVELDVGHRDFKPVTKAWFALLRQILHDHYTTEKHLAWTSVWNFLVKLLKEAMVQYELTYTRLDPEDISLVAIVHDIDHVSCPELSFLGSVQFYAANNALPANSVEHLAHASIANNITGPSWKVELINALSPVDLLQKYNKLPWLETIDGTWLQYGHIQSKFAQFFDVHDYPFDSHSLEIRGRLGCDRKVARFSNETANLSVSFGNRSRLTMGGTEWDVFQPRIRSRLISSGNRKSGKQLSEVIIEIPITRRWIHLMYQVIFPLTMIDLIGLLVYGINASEIFQRMQLFTALLVTLFAFNWTVMKGLPPVSYMTLMDYNFKFSFLILGLHCMTAAVSGLKSWGDHFRHTVNRVSLTIMCFFFLIIKLYVVKKAIASYQTAQEFRLQANAAEDDYGSENTEKKTGKEYNSKFTSEYSNTNTEVSNNSSAFSFESQSQSQSQAGNHAEL